MSKEVNFWKSRIDSAKKLAIFSDSKKSREESRAFYKGQYFTNTEKANWEGDEIQANLFRKIVNFISDSVYSQNPSLRVLSRKKLNNPQAAESVLAHLKYVWDECNQEQEVKTCWKDAYFGNISAIKIDFDKSRGLFRGKWVAGEIVFDPDASGDIARAKWFAEKVVLPRYRLWQDETFDPAAREAIQKRTSDSSSTEYLDKSQDDSEKNTDLETIWYIYTKEGVDPIQGKDSIKKRLLVYCESYNDAWLLNQPDPCPWLDDDEVPYAILRLDEYPGEPIGPALWRLVEQPCKAFNWAASYHFSDMRKTATRFVGYDRDKIEDPAVFKSRKHQIPVACAGDPKTAVSPFDIGQADKTIFDSVQFFYNMLDQLTGIDKIARGEEGQTKTATESQILQQNSNIVLRGPARALDKFLNDFVRKLALASLYYLPAFSVFPNPQGGQPVIDPVTGQQSLTPQFLTKQVVTVPVPMPGQVALNMQPQISIVPAPEAVAPLKGIDYFHGDEIAFNWPRLPFEEIKCDLAFTIEAGSTRQEIRLEKKRTALELFTTLGQVYIQMGFFEQYYELISNLIQNFEIDDITRFLPPKEVFAQQGMMMQQQLAIQEQKPGEGKQDNLAQSKNQGKSFPMDGKEGSTGS